MQLRRRRPAPRPSMDQAKRVRRPLDALSFFLADVRDGLGPYLAIHAASKNPAHPVSCHEAWTDVDEHRSMTG